MNVIILGKPGCGKGTLAKELEKRGYYILSGSDVLRENSKEKDAKYYKEARNALDTGVLISSEILNGMITEKVKKIGKDTSVVFDGYPRKMKQADHVINLYGKDNLRAFYIDLSDEVVEDRIMHRLVCKDCAAPFSTKLNKPKIEGICDHCGGELYKRKDDNKETMPTRLQEFYTKTLPVIEYLNEKIDVEVVPNDKNALEFILSQIR